nr:alpha-ketoglutarate-dependent dioxygenase AlkB [uncultured Gellertiella sp.]
MLTLPEGLRHLPHFLDAKAQQALVADIRDIVRQAQLYVPAMPRTGKPMSVRMTNCGSLGWVTDKERGYRYQAFHPATGAPWPAIPVALLTLWREITGLNHEPQACLVNFYDDAAKMGLHQDRDEQDLCAPVLSVSLGNSCLFRFGGLDRKDATRSIRLDSGDIVVLGGPSRLIFHGVDRIYPGTSPLLNNGGRINLTLRRVTKAG